MKSASSFSVFTALIHFVSTAGAEPTVSLLPVPEQGIQPRVSVDENGELHLLYFRGDPGTGDLYYAKRSARSETFADPIRVNSLPGSAVAMGTIRGGQLAVGKEGVVHVVWMGSRETLENPKDHHSTPLLYSRSNDGGKTFSEQRNVITTAFGLDGGGTVTADGKGKVHIVWHAPSSPDLHGEENRAVWLATSGDGGNTFAPERIVSSPGTGVCPCCSLQAGAMPEGLLRILYRGAEGGTGRGMQLLEMESGSSSVDARQIDDWRIAKCPMSSAAITGRGLLAWESRERVVFQVGPNSPIVNNPHDGHIAQKHPSLAVDADGNTLLVWSSVAGWGQPGTVFWRFFDPSGDPLGPAESRSGLPAWSFASAVFSIEAGFEIFY